MKKGQERKLKAVNFFYENFTHAQPFHTDVISHFKWMPLDGKLKPYLYPNPFSLRYRKEIWQENDHNLPNKMKKLLLHWWCRWM